MGGRKVGKERRGGATALGRSRRAPRRLLLGGVRSGRTGGRETKGDLECVVDELCGEEIGSVLKTEERVAEAARDDDGGSS